MVATVLGSLTAGSGDFGTRQHLPGRRSSRADWRIPASVCVGVHSWESHCLVRVFIILV